MDGRGYGSGFSNWGGGGSSSRGSGNYDMYGYRESSGFGGMKRGLFSSNTNADAVIAKLNQRLDMLTQLEGGMKGGRGDRFDQYESFDSRSSALDARDLYRSGNFYGDSRGDMMAQRGGMGFGAMSGAGGGGGFDGSATFGSPKMRQARDGWDAGHRSQHRGGRPGGHGFGLRQDSSMMQGLSPLGRGKPPSLFSNRMFPDMRGFQPQPGSQFGNRRSNQQRFHKRPLNRQQQDKQRRDGQKKRKQAQTPTDEPESKVGRTESAEDDGNKEESDQKDEKDDANPDTESKPEAEGETAGENEKTKLQGKQTPNSASKNKKKRGFFESRAMSRVMFSCSICKFRSFYNEDMEAHLESKFHKDHFKFLSNQLSKPTSDFLQEYLIDKYKKTEQRVNQLDNHSATICQMLRDQDHTRGLGMEHFMKKVEAAHCSACDVYVPMQPVLIQKHVKSYDHNYNRKMMMDQSKRSSMSVARSILNHKVIGKKLESFLKGENPFTGNQDEQDLEDSAVMEVGEGEGEGEGEPKPDEKQEDEPTVTEAVGNGEKEQEEEEQPEEMKMEEAGDEALAEEEEEEEEEGVEVQGEGDECLELEEEEEEEEEQQEQAEDPAE